MSLVLVPLPVDTLEESAPVWLPFVQSIAERGKWHLQVLVGNVMSGEVHICLVWEPEIQQARAMVGVRLILRGDDRIGEIIWLTGIGRKDWTGLLPDLETYLRDHHRCIGVTAIARPGWSKVLKSAGYRLTHVTMEKALS